MRSFGLILLFLGTIMIVSGYLKDKEKQNLAMKTKIVYRYIPKPLSAILDDPPAVDNMFREISSSDPWMDTTATEREIFNMNNKPSKSAGDNSVPEYFCDVCNKCMYKEITITEDGQTYKKYKKRNDWNLCKPLCMACKNTNYLTPDSLRKKVVDAHQKDFQNNSN